MSKVEWKRLGDVCCFKKGQMITLKTAIKGSVPVISSGQQPSFYHNCANRNGETIVVAGSGAYAGFVSYWDTPIFVADAFSVSPKNLQTIIVKYLFYYLQNNQETIYHTKTTGGIPHVYSRFIENYIIPIPPKHVQRQIVSQLDTFTTLISKLESELTLRQKQYEFYREELLNFDGDEEVEWKTLGELLDFKQPAKYIVGSTEYIEQGIPVLTAGQTFILGYTDEQEGIYHATVDEPVLIFDDFTTSFHYVTFDFKVKSSALKILTPKKGVNLKLVYNLMKGINYEPKEHSRQWISIYSKFKVLYPTSIDEQRRIVSQLDTFEQLIAALKREIALRRKQYDYYREKLLTFE